MLIPLDKSSIPSLSLVVPFSYELSYLGLFRQITLLKNSSAFQCRAVVSFCWGWGLLKLFLKNFTHLTSVLAWDSWIYLTHIPRRLWTHPMQRGLRTAFGHMVSNAPFASHLNFGLLFFVCISHDLSMIPPPSNLAAAAQLIKAFYTSCTSLSEGLRRTGLDSSNVFCHPAWAISLSRCLVLL